MSERVQAARRELVEALIVDVLVDNWYRISRYPDRELACFAIENVARELRERLGEAVLRTESKGQ